MRRQMEETDGRTEHAVPILALKKLLNPPVLKKLKVRCRESFPLCFVLCLRLLFICAIEVCRLIADCRLKVRSLSVTK